MKKYTIGVYGFNAYRPHHADAMWKMLIKEVGIETMREFERNPSSNLITSEMLEEISNKFYAEHNLANENTIDAVDYEKEVGDDITEKENEEKKKADEENTLINFSNYVDDVDQMAKDYLKRILQRQCELRNIKLEGKENELEMCMKILENDFDSVKVKRQPSKKNLENDENKAGMEEDEKEEKKETAVDKIKKSVGIKKDKK